MAITLVKPNEGGNARSIIGASGALYVVNQLGQVIVSDADAAVLVAQGWEPLAPGSGLNYATVNFGAFPGSNFATTTIPDAAAGTDVDAPVIAFVAPIATTDHSADEHAVDGPIVSAYGDGNGNIVINAYPNNNVPAIDNMKPWGAWTVAWAYLQ
jgi:hypothetical protein